MTAYKPSPEFAEVLSDLIDGAMSDAQHARLSQILTEDEDARAFYCDYMRVAAGVHWRWHQAGDVGAESERLATSLSADRQGQSSGALNQRPAPSWGATAGQETRSNPVRTALRGLMLEFANQPPAVAILLLVMLFGGILIWNLARVPPARQSNVVHVSPGQDLGTPGEAPTAALPAQGRPSVATAHHVEAPHADSQSPAVIAQLTRSVDANWNQANALSNGAALLAHQKLTLVGGLAEIVFDSGAIVILEGPAELEMGAPGEQGVHNACSLQGGKLFARVPAQAQGFTVYTPTMTIVDLGTEFGVRVAAGDALPPASGPQPASSSTEIQVLRGEVRIVPIATARARSERVKPVSLHAGQRAISDGSGAAPRVFPAERDTFVHELPAAPRLVPLATWPKDSPLKPGDIIAVTNVPKRFHCFKIDPRSGEQTLLATGFPYREIPVDHGQEWNCVAVEPDGNVLVGAKGLSALDAGLLRIDPRNGQIKVVTRGGLLKSGGIIGLVVADEGTIYAGYSDGASADSDFVLKIDPTTGKLTPLARFGVEITGVCLDVEARHLLASSSKDAAIGLLQLAPEPKLTRREFDRNLGNFNCVAVNHQGRIFVGAALEKSAEGTQVTHEQKIIEVDRDSRQPVKTWAVMNKVRPEWLPMSLVCEADGNLIVNFGGADRHVYRVDTNTGKVTELSTGGLIETATFLAVVPSKPSAPANENAR